MAGTVKVPLPPPLLIWARIWRAESLGVPMLQGLGPCHLVTPSLDPA